MDTFANLEDLAAQAQAETGANNEGDKTTTFQLSVLLTPLIYNCLFHFKFANVSNDFASNFANLRMYLAVLLVILQICECMKRFCS